MVEDFFRHTCDIYTGEIGKSSGSYGLPKVNTSFVYPALPGFVNIPCLFSYDETAIIENEPRLSSQLANEIALPYGTAISYGDKVIDKRFGVEYTIGYPNNIRDKYIHAPLHRLSRQEAL